MNTERTSSSASRLSISASHLSVPAARNCRVFFAWLAAALLLVGLAATASQAGLKPVSASGTGAVFALAAQLRNARALAAAGASTSPHTSGGRALLPRTMMRPGAILKSRAAAASVVPISGGVQTYDVDNPPPAFRPLVGFGSASALGNSSSNPPVYISSLTPINGTPIWSADETFFVYSSNRTQLGGVNADATDGSGGSRFHLWAISVNGGEAFQITTSTGPAGGGELFPALSGNNQTVAFTSDASTPGTQNLYAIPFSYSGLSAGTTTVTDLTASTINPTPTVSLTLRAPTEAASSQLTGFDQVLRPTFSPNDAQEIVFAAHSVTGTYHGFDHLYYLYTSSGGFSNNNNVSYPGKLTDGPSSDTDPAFAPDGSYIAFDSTANVNGFTNNSNDAFGPNVPSNPQDPDASQSLSSGSGATRSLFLIGGGSNGVAFGEVPAIAPTLSNPGNRNLTATGGRVSQGNTRNAQSNGTQPNFDDYGPAWSSPNQNNYTNPAGNFSYLAFARSTGSTTALHDIYYFQVATGVSNAITETLVPETPAGGANVAVKLNTDDNPNETSAAGNVFDDIYPTWSPFLSIFSIAYTSNRTITYNNPANSVPVEIAASVPEGGAVNNVQDSTADYTVGTAYTGLLISQVLNLDPPSLLRFSADEVIHVQAGSNLNPVTGTPNKLAASGGQSVTMTVRLSDREAGIADPANTGSDGNPVAGGPNGGPRVYVQIKDPDGKYQDAQLTEHKVFVKDRNYAGQANQPLSDVTSGTADGSLGSEFLNYGSFTNDGLPQSIKYSYPSYGPKVGNINVGYVSPRGVHGGLYPVGTNNPFNTYIFVGKDGGGTNTATVDGQPLSQRGDIIHGGDPLQYIPWGPEYECQVVNPTFAAGGTGDTTPDNPGITVSNPGGTIGDYVSPFYLAGVDDQGAFSGGTYDSTAFATSSSAGRTGTDRPVADYSTTQTANGNTTTTEHPAEWLQLTRVPPAQQDNLGGVLYYITWPTPATGSDFYVDVIAYDNAVFPAFPAGTSNFTGLKTNWRIYDNVGGFSTNQSVGGTDILLVSDYALGQKFSATTFGGRNFNLNLVPTLFGTESYLSDVDVNILPDSVYGGFPTTYQSYQFQAGIRPFNDDNFFANSLTNPTQIEEQNGLGVGSYFDTVIDDNARVPNSLGGTSAYNKSQKYSIWRILSRGPVPASLLQSYTPTPVLQPSINDAADPAYASIPAATILDAPRCVIWLSPYTGDVLADPGTLADPGNIGVTGTTQPRSSTTSILTKFVQNGGRLFVTGQDVGSALTQGGTVNNMPSTTAGAPNFLPDVLNAQLTANQGGTNVLAATNNRITGPPTYDGSYSGRVPSNLSVFVQGGETDIFGDVNLAYQDNLVLGDADYGDGAFSQIPAQILPGGASVQAQIDVITPLNGATTAITYGTTAGPGAMVYHDDEPYNPANTGVLPGGGTGSRVVYAAFGLEGLSNDYFTVQDPSPDATLTNAPPFDERIPPVAPRNPRPLIIHNIVNYLRTGYVTGNITNSSNGGSGLGGVTVYLRPITGTPPPTRAAFSALTNSSGTYTIAGIEPGTYTLVAIKPGFQRAVSNSNVSFLLEGDVTVNAATLAMTQEQPGNIAGVVQDTSGNPINGATVTFTSRDNSVTETITTANGSVPGNTAENYFIQNVPVTTYTGTATGPLNSQGLAEYLPAKTPDKPTATGAPDYSQGVPVQPSTTTQPVKFTLTAAPASISGTVLDSGTGAFIAGATVTLTGPSGTVLATTTAKADGTYSFTGIAATTAAANYTVSATAPRYAPGSVVQPLQAGSVYTGINIPLAGIPSGTISGVVTDKSTGLGLVGATVTFTLPGGTTQTTTTKTGGTYTLLNIPTGTYSGIATGPATGQAYVPSDPQTATVTNGGTVTANFALVPVLSGLTGTVTDATTNLPLAGVTITVMTTSGIAVATNPTPITTDANGKFSATLAPGTYVVTAAKASYTSQNSAPTVFALSATVPVSFKLTSSIGTIGGLVTDQNGTGLVSGATVTAIATGQTTGLTFTTSATSTTGPDGSPINYSGQLAVGTYKVTVTKGTRTSATQTITVTGGAFVRADFTAAAGLPALYTFPSGTQFVSTPYDYSSLGFSGLFGALNTAAAGTTPNGNRSNVAVWNPLTGAYALDPNAPADALRLGVGYWVYLKNATPVTVQGATPTAAYVSVALQQGWNQIGVPNPSASGVPISSLLFASGTGSTITFAQAGSSQYNLVTRPLYSYSGGTTYQSLSSTGTLVPWKGYWIYANAAATLEIPTK